MKPKAYNAKISPVKRSILVGALALSQTVVSTSFALPALALDNEIKIAGQGLFTVSGAGGMTADKRAEAIQQNLDNALVAAKDRTPASVKIT